MNFNPVKYGATIEISTELLDDWMWPPRDDYETENFKLDREHGWWMKPDKRFKSGWRPVVEKAVVNPDGSRAVTQFKRRTWKPGMERPF